MRADPEVQAEGTAAEMAPAGWQDDGRVLIDPRRSNAPARDGTTDHRMPGAGATAPAGVRRTMCRAA